jgi:peptide/nickel transport system ATP-binding protein
MIETPIPPVPAPLLSLQGLRVRFPRSRGQVVNGLDLDIHRGEAVALVGESGCGKSTTALAVMGLLPPGSEVEGRILLDGQDLLATREKDMRRIRGNRIAMVFQEPMHALNPVHRIGDQIIEALAAHLPLGRAARRARMLELLDRVRLPDPLGIARAYPHQLSGGQRQRVVIAMAIACEPQVLVADEPTTALDATIQKDILELLDGLRRDLSMGLLLISHDLPIVSQWTDRVVVLHHGEAMEELPSAALFAQARHTYTRGLIGASLQLDANLHHSRDTLPEIRVDPNGGDYRFDLVAPERPRQALTEKPAATLLRVEGLVVDYASANRTVNAVRGVSFEVQEGATLGIVGESGSGKSTLSKAVARLLPTQGGRILFRDQDITAVKGERLRAVRKDMQMIFQDPYNSLNPRHTVGDLLEDVLYVHGEKDAAERQRRVARMLDQVGLPRSAMTRFAHEFSGGQRQRVGIARALILKPALVICDEPVSALDVSVQAQVLNLLTALKLELGLTYLFISHDLAVIQYMSDRVLVMQKGAVVENREASVIWQAPEQEYTRQLIDAVRLKHPAAAAPRVALDRATYG